MMNEKYHAEEMIEAFSQGRYEYVLEHALPAAEAGNADAQCMIGCLYQLATGVPQDGSEAARWYRKPLTRIIRSRGVIWAPFMFLVSWARLMRTRAEDVIYGHINWEVLLMPHTGPST